MLSALCQRGTSRKLSHFGRNVFCFANAPAKFTAAVTRTSSTSLRKPSEDVPFQNIYKFPYIALIRGVCRLKIYQTATVFIAVPYVGVFQPEALLSTICISGLAFFMLFVMGELFRRVIGIVYYNSKEDLVKISHLTFWGRRKDIIVPREDIVPLSDMSENSRDIYNKVLRYSDPKSSLFLCLRFGGVSDHKCFTHVFGHTE